MQIPSAGQDADGYDYNELIIDRNFSSEACKRIEATTGCRDYDRSIL